MTVANPSSLIPREPDAWRQALVDPGMLYPAFEEATPDLGEWTQERLRSVARDLFADSRLVVVSNREPYTHQPDPAKPSGLTWRRPAGGLVSGLDPVMQAVEGGLWVAQGTGEADSLSVDASGRVAVPPDHPSYMLKRIWLKPDEVAGYYEGFSNQGLWPLCHVVFLRPRFTPRDWRQYQQVNRRFAEAVLEEVGDQSAYVWVQDYHLCLVPRYLREARPDLTTGIFWHIPWPNPEIYRTCPFGAELLEGMLAADVIGFHIRYHGANFFATVEQTLEARLDRERWEVIRSGHRTRIVDIPISVDFEEEEATAQSSETAQWMEEFRRTFDLDRYEHVLLGLDRFDYTKGIPERLMAVDLLLQEHPEYKGKLVFLQVGEISRIQIAHYQALNAEVEHLAQEINDRHRTPDWAPVVLWRNPVDRPDLMALFRLANVCVVSSLHDGMNLVAKEYVASRFDERGVLVLSRFTGAARELPEALLINPYDASDIAHRLHEALQMSELHQRERMRRMRRTVRRNNIYAWAGRFLREMVLGGV